MDKNYIELYSKDGKEGVNIKGQDVVLLDAPEVRLSPDTPLLTNAQDVAGAINELFQLDPGGGEYLSDMGTLKAVVDDGAANLSIILTDNGDNDSGEPILSEYQYTYTAKQISESVTTSATVGETTTKNTKSWSNTLSINCIMPAVNVLCRRFIPTKQRALYRIIWIRTGTRFLLTEGI